jgi:flagellar hook protein FlgE
VRTGHSEPFQQVNPMRAAQFAGLDLPSCRRIADEAPRNAVFLLARFMPQHVQRTLGALSMSLFGAMNTAISGLTAQSSAFGNIGDNVANSQTVGYKRVDTNFIDYLTVRRDRTTPVPW